MSGVGRETIARAAAEAAELRALREGIRALADEMDRSPARRWLGKIIRALLVPSPAATTGEAECAGVRVNGPVSAMICDDDGWVRSGTFHRATDYKCTGSVHLPLDSPIWPGHEIRCANPIHVVKLPLTTVLGTVTIANATLGTFSAPVSSGEAGTGEALSPGVERVLARCRADLAGGGD